MADNALGRFLRARREATTPAAVGLPAGTRRRTPGLRRGELAERAGISVEYLTRLERGSDRYPSGQVLGALADALTLSPDERVHLYRLIKAGSGEACQQAAATVVPRPTVLALLSRLEPTAALLVDATGDVLASTAGFRALAAPTGLLDDDPPNLTRFVFTHSRARTVYPEWDRIADDRAASVRAAADLGDPAASALAVELSITAGAEFADRFAAAATLPSPTGVELWVRPSGGTVRLAYETLAVPGVEEHRLVVYLPDGDATEGSRRQSVTNWVSGQP
jgi:transcriptional regulator with XRE-family HTH domain